MIASWEAGKGKGCVWFGGGMGVWSWGAGAIPYALPVNAVLCLMPGTIRPLPHSHTPPQNTHTTTTTLTPLAADAVTWVVLGSDGLWDVMSNEEAVKLARKSTSPEVAARKLASEAYLRGSEDNISVLVCRVGRE